MRWIADGDADRLNKAIAALEAGYVHNAMSLLHQVRASMAELALEKPYPEPKIRPLTLLDLQTAYPERRHDS